MSICCAILLSILVSATSEFVSYEMNNEYSTGEIISGKFTINLSDEQNGNFSSNFGGDIELLEMLEKSQYIEGEDYTCNPSGCGNKYSISNPSETKSFSLSRSKKIGFVIKGKEAQISNFKFHISSDIPSTCGNNQVIIDLFDDKKIDFYNYNYVDRICGNKIYGCFNSTSSVEATIPRKPSEPYCEKISLTPAPAYRIGAKIINSTSGGILTMSMYDSLGEFVGECELPKHSKETQELDCIIQYPSLNEIDALVCISASSGNYKIRTELDNPCGRQGPYPEEDYQADYEIYAKALKYGYIDQEFNSSIYKEDDLISVIQDYIYSTYDGECVPNCVIPMSISGASQNITLSSILIEYNVAGIEGNEVRSAYDISSEPFTISADSLTFNLEDIGIKAPASAGNQNFRLFLNDNLLFNRTIKIVRGVDFIIEPRAALIGQKTIFRIISSENITSAKWDFGDGKTTESEGKVEHVYTEQGSFNVNVEVISNGTISRKDFEITVGNPQASAELMIAKYESRLANLSQELNKFSPDVRVKIQEEVSTEEMMARLEEIKTEFEKSTEEDEYIEIINKLIELNVPYRIDKRISGKLKIDEGFNNLDVGIIGDISEEDNIDDEAVENAIINWIISNYEVDVKYETITLYGDYDDKDILNVFEYDIIKVGEDDSSEIYFIINYPASEIKLLSSHELKDSESAAYIELNPNGEKVKFAIKTHGVSVADLGAYLSPRLEQLEIDSSTIEPEGDGGFRWKFFIIWISIIVLATFIAYIILQEWYKRYYEKSLFKNSNDLYNLINFIYNARVSGLKDDDIKKKLIEIKWKGEQIRYAFNKIDGKRTGMYEIPLFKNRENTKVREEIERRHDSPIDTRFIKGSNL